MAFGQLHHNSRPATIDDGDQPHTVTSRLHPDDGHNLLESVKVNRIPCVKRKTMCRGSRSDQEICHACATGAAGGSSRRKYTRIGARGICVERKRVPSGGCPLEAVLASRPLRIVIGRMWTRCQFGQRNSEIADSSGRTSGSMRLWSTTTEVSSRPRIGSLVGQWICDASKSSRRRA